MRFPPEKKIYPQMKEVRPPQINQISAAHHELAFQRVLNIPILITSLNYLSISSSATYLYTIYTNFIFLFDFNYISGNSRPILNRNMVTKHNPIPITINVHGTTGWTVWKKRISPITIKIQEIL